MSDWATPVLICATVQQLGYFETKDPDKGDKAPAAGEGQSKNKILNEPVL